MTPELPDSLRERLERRPGGMTLEAYVDCVLYHPETGYYARRRRRVGRSEETDFYTAASLGSVFARLVLDAAEALAGNPLEGFSFVEIGPETETGILGSVDARPFADCRLIRHGDPLEIPSPAVVFSNELFDAQPFRRLVRDRGRWKEAGVTLAGNTLQPVLLEPAAPPPALPDDLPDGYTVDWPSGAIALMKRIGAVPWTGLFIAFDYGLDRSTILRDRPQGTARTYAGHTMGGDLLENPGQRDITCHVAWDDLEDVLRQSGFTGITLERQEAFFMRHARKAIESILEPAKIGFSRDKQTLMELLHPDNMGHKFQVLHGSRQGNFI